MQVGTFEAKNRLSELLDMAERGHEVVITRRGVAVAKLVPVKAGHDMEKARAALARIVERGRGTSLGGLEIKDLIEEGRP